MGDFGYKLVYSYGRVLCKLQISGDTNEDRQDVCDWRFAKCKTNRARVMWMRRLSDGATITRANSYFDPSFIYETKRVVKTDNFDPDELYGDGIHYFKTKEAAIAYDVQLGMVCQRWACGREFTQPSIGLFRDCLVCFPPDPRR